MRPASEYRNYSRGARSLARILDLAAAPVLGSPRGDVRRAADARPASRILLIRPDHAGDLLMATPAIRALRLARPEATLDLLASPWGAPAVRDNPDIDRVLTIEATWFEPGRREGPDPAGLIGDLLALRCGRYDAAADLRGDFRSILIARASGARRRAGFSRIGLEALLTDAIPYDPFLDHVSRNHAAVSLLGAGPLRERRPVFVVPQEAGDAARRLLAPLPRDRPVVAVFPGTNRRAASWGTARFARSCRLLAATRAVSIVVGGREADREAAAEVSAAAGGAGENVLDLAGRTDLAQAAALIRESSVLLANDSGAAHLAVAVGTPAVAIFGPTDPATLWTWDHKDRYVGLAGPTSCTRPCFRAGCSGDHGYSAILPEEVAALLDRLIDAGPEDPPR